MLGAHLPEAAVEQLVGHWLEAAREGGLLAALRKSPCNWLPGDWWPVCDPPLSCSCAFCPLHEAACRPPPIWQLCAIHNSNCLPGCRAALWELRLPLPAHPSTASTKICPLPGLCSWGGHLSGYRNAWPETGCLRVHEYTQVQSSDLAHLPALVPRCSSLHDLIPPPSRAV